MRAHVNVSALSAELGFVRGLFKDKDAVRLTAGDGALTLSAAGTFKRLTSTLPAVVGLAGSVVVPGDLFAQCISGIDDASHDSVELTGMPKRLHVQSGDFQAKLVLTTGEAPYYPLKTTDTFVADSAKLISILKVIQPATESTIRANCIRIESGQDTLVGIGTDGRRLALVAYGEAERDKAFLFPLGGITDLQHVAEAGATVDFSYSGEAADLKASSGHRTLESSLQRSVFPPYQKFLSDPVTTVTIGRVAIAAALKRLAISTGDKAIGFTFDAAGKAITLTSESSREAIVASESTGNFRAIMSTQFVLQTVVAMQSSQVTFGYGGKGKPISIQEAGQSRQALVIFMPMDKL